MSSTPLASTGAGPASAVGPARSASSRQDRRADPIPRSSSSQSSHASLSGEADNVANILRHAARLARLDPASFPTVYNTSAAIFLDSQLAMAPLLAQLIAMVNDLGASVTFLTSQVETFTSAQAERSATPSPPATSHQEASLKDLSSRVAALTRLPPQIFPFFSRANGMATQTRTLNATLTHLKLLSFLPHVIPSRKKPSFTPGDTQPPHSSIPVHPPVSVRRTGRLSLPLVNKDL